MGTLQAWVDFRWIKTVIIYVMIILDWIVWRLEFGNVRGLVRIV